MGNPPILESVGNMYDWLVVWNMFFFPFHIWDVILPIDELHHVSRWLKPPTSYYCGILWLIWLIDMVIWINMANFGIYREYV